MAEGITAGTVYNARSLLEHDFKLNLSQYDVCVGVHIYTLPK